MATEITEFAAQSNGTRIRSFTTRGIKVAIHTPTPEKDEEAHAIAEKLHASASKVEFRWTEIEAKAERATNRAREMEARALAAEAKLPPTSPTRLLGAGCVRFDAKGALWLMNKREGGWASFGVQCDDWDDLFRRYNVRVTTHGTDECGAWWEVVSC